MVAGQWCVNVVTAQKNLGVTRILGCDDIDFPKYTHGAKGNVFEIADGRGNDVENTEHRKYRDIVSLANFASGYLLDLMTLAQPSRRDLGKLTQRSCSLQFTAHPLS
jgi:hypothetical protein